MPPQELVFLGGACSNLSTKKHIDASAGTQKGTKWRRTWKTARDRESEGEGERERERERDEAKTEKKRR